MRAGTAQKISNAILSCAAGFASFIFSLAAPLYLTEFDEKILAALVAGAFCLLISYVASERPNSESARAQSASSERLLAVDDGDLVSPAPPSLKRTMPKLAAAVESPFELCSHSVDIGASIGVAITPDHGTSIESLMRAADIAMYRAESSGGGQHCLFNSDLAAEHQQKIEIEKALTEAVQRGDFVLAFQPQMSLVTGEVVGAEALLRWNRPRDGLRLPGTFIPIAEWTGVIAET